MIRKDVNEILIMKSMKFCRRAVRLDFVALLPAFGPPSYISASTASLTFGFALICSLSARRSLCVPCFPPSSTVRLGFCSKRSLPREP